MLTYPREVRAYSETEAGIKVYCMRYTADGSGDYVLRLTAADSSSPAPAESEIRAGDDSMAEFSVMLDEPGTYRYRLSQLPGDSGDTVYDSRVYDIVLFAQEGTDGSIIYAVTASEDGSSEKAYRIEFRNEQTGSTDPPVTTVTEPSTEPPVTTTATSAETTEKTTEQTTAGTETFGTSTAETAVTTAERTTEAHTTSAVDSAKTGDGFSPVRTVTFMAAAAAAAVILRKRRHI